MSTSRARGVPFTSIGYVVVIVSFALLGLFAYGLASGFSTAWIFGAVFEMVGIWGPLVRGPASAVGGPALASGVKSFRPVKSVRADRTSAVGSITEGGTP